MSEFHIKLIIVPNLDLFIPLILALRYVKVTQYKCTYTLFIVSLTMKLIFFC